MGKEEVGKQFWLNVGDRPGWETPVLLVFDEDFDCIEVPISREVADELKEFGVPFQG